VALLDRVPSGELEVRERHPKASASASPLRLEQSLDVKLSVPDELHEVNGSQVANTFRGENDFRARIHSDFRHDFLEQFPRRVLDAESAESTTSKFLEVNEPGFPFRAEHRKNEVKHRTGGFPSKHDGVVAHPPMVERPPRVTQF